LLKNSVVNNPIFIMKIIHKTNLQKKINKLGSLFFSQNQEKVMKNVFCKITKKFFCKKK